MPAWTQQKQSHAGKKGLRMFAEVIGLIWEAMTREHLAHWVPDLRIAKRPKMREYPDGT